MGSIRMAKQKQEENIEKQLWKAANNLDSKSLGGLIDLIGNIALAD